MFALEKFRIVERKRAVATAKLAPANDNRRGTRHTPGRTALVGHWRRNTQTGRLEWHWSLEPIADDLTPSPGSPNPVDAARPLGHLGVIRAEH